MRDDGVPPSGTPPTVTSVRTEPDEDVRDAADARRPEGMRAAMADYVRSVHQAYASGAVDPRPLVAATVGLDDVGGVLAGEWPAGAGVGPKIHVDPWLGVGA